MELRKLQYFIAVAEHKSFTSAAKYNFISQPSLSRQISELEGELGITLFKRSKRNVSLTPEGEKLLILAKNIVSQSHEMLLSSRMLNSKGAGSISIGYPGYWEFDYITNIIKYFSLNNPHIQIKLIKKYHAELYEKLLSRECDIVFTIMSESELSEAVVWKPLIKTHLHLIVPPNHYLANRKSVNINELKNEQFILISRPENPNLNDVIISSCFKQGFSPNITFPQPSNILDLILLITANKGISFACSWLKSLCPHLCFIPLEDPTPLYEFGLAYNKDEQTPCINSFLNVVDSNPFYFQKKDDFKYLII